MVSTGMKVIKYLLFIFNFIFFVTGVVLLGIGIYVQVTAKHYTEFVSKQYVSLPILLIIIGCIITIIAFFGCCGACKESHCMMITFSVLLAIIFILELAAGIVAYVKREDIEKDIKKNMRESLSHYNTSDEATRKLWDVTQHENHCCGVDGIADWGENVPQSCCKEDSEVCAKEKTNFYQNGCYNAIKDVLIGNIVIIGGIGIGIAFVQIIGIICACCLASAIKREYETV